MFASFAVDAQGNTSAPQSTAPKLNNIQSSASQPIIIHRKSEYFIDIEAPLDKVWMGCDYQKTKGKLKDEDDVAFMGFNVIDGDESYDFFYRRPLSIKMCLEEERNYRKVLGKSKTIRLVCDHPSLETGPEKTSYTRVPKRFLNATKRWHCFFGRMQAGGRCKAFFEDDCDIKKNYWMAAPTNNLQ